MQNKEGRLVQLLVAYMNEQINEADFEELISLMQQTDKIGDEERLAILFDEAWKQVDQRKDLPFDAELVFSKIIADPQIRTFPLKKHRYAWIAIAGIAALICLTVLLFLFYQGQLTYTPQGVTTVKKNDEQRSRATSEVILTLADGSRIPVNTLREGVQTLQSGGRLLRKNDQLIYSDGETDAGVQSPPLHTVTTPIGMDYKLRLPDGTQVQLNAGSSITYPVAFHAKERKVELIGEAYFEVTGKPRQPFVLQANGTKIQVLGTSFNVRAYKDERYVATTLISGGVLVHSKKLKPGQQAVNFVRNSKVEIREVDIEEALAWRKGHFFFDNDDIKDVMKTIARWYDIEVIYEGDLNGKTFGGTLSRYADFHQLLYAMERTGSVKFRIVGRRVMVSP